MKNTKAQAALEFLTTYGWAILVVMVAIGALAYFGVLNPSKSLPERCVFGNGIVCNDWQILGDATLTNNQVKFSLQNGLGITLNTITATVTDSTGFASPCVMSPVSDWASDSSKSFVCTQATGVKFTEGDKAKVKITINYVKSGGTYNQISLGEVYATVQ